MSTENNETAGWIDGSVEFEANDTVIFVSGQGRRIRFQYIGASQQHPGAAVYKCTQCPVKALMTYAQFRFVDPCAGHDCSIGAFHPHRPPPTDATKAVWTPQQSPPTLAQATRSSSPMKNTPKVIAKATYDANGCVQWLSERYTGTTFKFNPNKCLPGRRRYFYCLDCARKCAQYKSGLEACGIKRRYLIVLDDNIVDYHPDDAGTTQGHLCQEPLLEEKLKAKALEIATPSTPNIAEAANGGKEDAQCVQKIEVTDEPSTKSGDARERSIAKRSRAQNIISHEDKTFGKARALPASTLTKAEHRVWSSAPSINTGPMRDKELIAYRSQKHKRLFKFVLAGPSSLDEYAFDFFCLDCWINHEEECRVTVRSWTQEFIITDPDQTSSGRHACMPTSSARPSDSLAVAQKPLSGIANTEGERLRTESCVDSVVKTPLKPIEYFSERYQAGLKFVVSGHGKNGQSYYACAKCRSLHGKLKQMGYHRFGFTEVRLHLAVVVGGRFVQRHPDECGVELFDGDTAERRHICHDDKFKSLLKVAAAVCEDSREPSPKRLRDATQGAPVACAVDTSIRTQSVGGSRADTSPRDDSNRALLEQLAGSQAVMSRRMDCAVDQAATEQATATSDDGSSRQSDVDLGPAVDALDELLQQPDSGDGTDANGTPLATSSTSKKPAKREPVENNDAERLQEEPAAKFHRFLKDFNFLEDYARHSMYHSGVPTAFVMLPHVIEKWIQFNQRN